MKKDGLAVSRAWEEETWADMDMGVVWTGKTVYVCVCGFLDATMDGIIDRERGDVYIYI